eukprot:GHUV01010634.1.p1 GENE.GHUV01010634.1~~GHUV01010634.1.p1  ORF type:complete len:262 (-),score=56.14 GHUV01010634.1:53-838(-)
MMYSGATDDLVPWFESLGFSYEPTVHGLVPDWALDLVSQGFSNSPAANPVSNGHSAGHSASNGHGRATAFVSQRRQHQLQLDRAGSDKDTARFGGKCTIDPLAAAAEAFLWHLKDQQRGSLECSPGKLSETAGGAYTVGLGGLLHGGGSSSNSSTDAASDSLSSLDVRMPAVQGGGSKCGWLSRAGVGAAFKRYRALLWREAVFMTRCGHVKDAKRPETYARVLVTRSFTIESAVKLLLSCVSTLNAIACQASLGPQWRPE